MSDSESEVPGFDQFIKSTKVMMTAMSVMVDEFDKTFGSALPPHIRAEMDQWRTEITQVGEGPEHVDRMIELGQSIQKKLAEWQSE